MRAKLRKNRQCITRLLLYMLGNGLYNAQKTELSPSLCVIPLGFEPKTHALEGRCSNPTELRNRMRCKSSVFCRYSQAMQRVCALTAQTGVHGLGYDCSHYISISTSSGNSLPMYSKEKLAPRADGNWLRKSTSVRFFR